MAGGLAVGVLERAYGPYVFGGWEQFPFYDASRSGNWYDLGFLLGVGSPVMGAVGRRDRRGQ